MSEIFIEQVGERDRPIALALLSPVANADTLLFLARDEAGNLLGAAGAGWQSWGNPPGFPSWVHVLPDRRREGVGTKLMRALCTAVEGEMAGLWAATPLDVSGPAAAFASRNCFNSFARQFFFRADAEHFLERMEAVTDRLLQHSRIPSTAKLVVPDAANAEAVCDLISSEVRGAPRQLRQDLLMSFDADPATAPIDLNRSLVLKLEHHVVGALLTRRMPDAVNTRIIANTVAPSVRKGWANPFQIVALVRRIVEDGGKWFEFDCSEDVKDTIGLARRGEADCIRVDSLFRYAFTALDA